MWFQQRAQNFSTCHDPAAAAGRHAAQGLGQPLRGQPRLAAPGILLLAQHNRVTRSGPRQRIGCDRLNPDFGRGIGPPPLVEHQHERLSGRHPHRQPCPLLAGRQFAPQRNQRAFSGDAVDADDRGAVFVAIGLRWLGQRLDDGEIPVRNRYAQPLRFKRRPRHNAKERQFVFGQPMHPAIRRVHGQIDDRRIDPRQRHILLQKIVGLALGLARQRGLARARASAGAAHRHEPARMDAEFRAGADQARGGADQRVAAAGRADAAIDLERRLQHASRGHELAAGGIGAGTGTASLRHGLPNAGRHAPLAQHVAAGDRGLQFATGRMKEDRQPAPVRRLQEFAQPLVHIRIEGALRGDPGVAAGPARIRAALGDEEDHRLVLEPAARLRRRLRHGDGRGQQDRGHHNSDQAKSDHEQGVARATGIMLGEAGGGNAATKPPNTLFSRHTARTDFGQIARPGLYFDTKKKSSRPGNEP